MASKVYCDMCHEELPRSLANSFRRYFEMTNDQDEKIVVSVKAEASSLRKRLFGSSYQRQIGDPDLCVGCIRRIILEGEPWQS